MRAGGDSLRRSASDGDFLRAAEAAVGWGQGLIGDVLVRTSFSATRTRRITYSG
jgi:hypothetical protein